MNLSGKTQVVGLFGDPVAHSLSPRMQNAALAALDIDAVYVPFHVTQTQLCDAVAGIRALNIRGVNLTIPHKEAACDLVDELDEQAARIGAINTIVNRDGVLFGYNTDGLGLVAALQSAFKIDLQGKNVLLLGAGGACRAALVALADAGVSRIGIANRTVERAAELVQTLSEPYSGTAFAHYPLSGSLSAELFGPVDLLINTSSIGLKGESFGPEIFDCLSGEGVVFDMVYSREGTPLVSAARSRGFQAADGLRMLAGQGEAAFALWFDQPAPEGLMLQALTS